MKKSISISLATIASLAAVAMPMAAISCVRLTPKQKEVKKLLKEFRQRFDKIATKLESIPLLKSGIEKAKTQFEKFNDEEIAKLDDIHCDETIKALELAIKLLDQATAAIDKLNG